MARQLFLVSAHEPPEALSSLLPKVQQEHPDPQMGSPALPDSDVGPARQGLPPAQGPRHPPLAVTSERLHLP